MTKYNKDLRHQRGTRLALFGAVANLALAVGKIAVGALYSSTAAAADGFNNLSDFLGFGIALFGFRLSLIPADRKHPHGHARMEYLANLAISVLILVMGLELFISSFKRILNPVSVELTPLFFFFLVLSVLVKGALALLFFRGGKHLSSKTLKLAAIDSRNDAVATLGVLFSAALERLWDIPADGAVGLGIAACIFLGGIGQIRKSVSPLLGEAVDKEKEQRILACIQENELVLGWHDLLVHDYGPDKCYASLHLEVDGRADAIALHEMADEMERRCLEETGVELVIHCDPAPPEESEEMRFRSTLEKALWKKDPQIGLHDLVYQKEEGILSFHLTLPSNREAEKDEIRRLLEETVSETECGKIRLDLIFEMQ